MTSFVRTSASFVYTSDAPDRGQVSCETSMSDAFVRPSDAFLYTSASLVCTSDAFVSMKTERKASERPARNEREASERRAKSEREASENRARGQCKASEMPVKGARGASEKKRKPSERPAQCAFRRSAGRSGFAIVAIGYSFNRKGRSVERPFCFYPLFPEYQV